MRKSNSTIGKKTKAMGLIIILLIMSLTTVILAAPGDDFSLKWTCDTGLSSYIGPVIKDIDGDGTSEIFLAGIIDGGSGGRVMCIDGSNGDIIWQKYVSGLESPHCPLAIGDLDNDGDYEIVHGRTTYGSGTVARNCEDGSIFWDVSYPARYHQLAIADTDENGYPYVFITSDDDNGGNGQLRKLKGTDGSLVASHPVHKPCFGGISIADLENDGEYEIILTDRSGSGDGVSCYDEDLNQLWNYEVLCSSHAAVIVDVDDDGVLDVVVMRQSSSSGGIYVIDGSTGQLMPGKYGSSLGLTTHCQPSVYDIDNDGNLELITAWDANPKVWDLGSWSLDKTLYVYCSEPPDYANVMGDSDLEIIACSGQGNKVYDSDYDLVYSFPQSVGSLWSVTQDIDDDGLNEILFLVGDTLRAYNTLASSPNPKVRTDTPYYSERRTASGIYIPKIGEGGGPSNNPPTFWDLNPENNANDVSIDTTSISLSIADPDGDTIDWTIETSPDIGSSSGNNEGNGRKYCSVSNLDYSTTYNWFVNATDGESWKRRTFTFTTEGQTGNDPPTFWDLNPNNGADDVSVDLSSLSIMISDPDGDPIDWTIETSPDIGSSSGNNEGNGRKYCSVSNLDYSTTYNWFVNATDGESWKRRTYSFSTENQPGNNPPTFWSSNPANNANDVSVDLSSLSIMISDPDGDPIDWKIETSPDIGSISRYNQGNGEKYCSISNLEYATIYHWYVNATDGKSWKRNSYTFVTENVPGSTPPSFWSSYPSNGAKDISIDISSLSIIIGDSDGNPIDWTIETSPDIGSSSGNNEGNGRKYCSVSNLDYSFTYHWFVNATDGESWKRRTFTFTVENHAMPPGGTSGGSQIYDPLPAQGDVAYLDNNPPNTPIIPFGESEISKGTFYNFSSLTNDIDNDTIRLKFDWGDGNCSNWSEFKSSNTTISMSHRWDQTGTFEIRTIAQDEHGLYTNWSNPFTIVVNQEDINIKPFVNILASRNVSTNENIMFEAAGIKYPSQDIKVYKWDFGDGESSEGEKSTHVYRNPGLYTVTLFIIDTDENVYTEKINVSVAQSGTTGPGNINDNVNSLYLKIISSLIVLIGFIIFIFRKQFKSFLSKFSLHRVKKFLNIIYSKLGHIKIAIVKYLKIPSIKRIYIRFRKITSLNKKYLDYNIEFSNDKIFSIDINENMIREKIDNLINSHIRTQIDNLDATQKSIEDFTNSNFSNDLWMDHEFHN